MQKVYILEHRYEKGHGYMETKLLGIFSSRQEAEAAIKGYTDLPGFRIHPEDFCIDEFELDEKHWAEGFEDLSKKQN